MGTKKAQEVVADAIVKMGSNPEFRYGRRTSSTPSSSYAEYRSRANMRVSLADSQDDVFWRYMTASPVMLDARGDEPEWAPSRYLIEPSERRTLSKATGPAGGFTVPSDFDTLITSARRARNVIGNVSRVLLTDHGRAIPLPTATAHGVGTWTSENAAVTPSDDTFAQVTVNASKATTKTILSEELAQDAWTTSTLTSPTSSASGSRCSRSRPSLRATAPASRRAS